MFIPALRTLRAVRWIETRLEATSLLDRIPRGYSVDERAPAACQITAICSQLFLLLSRLHGSNRPRKANRAIRGQPIAEELTDCARLIRRQGDRLYCLRRIWCILALKL